MAKSDSTKLEALRQKAAQIKARLADLEARENKSKRAARNRALALLGVVLEADLKANDGAEIQPLRDAAERLLKGHDAKFLVTWLEEQFPAQSQDLAK